MLVLFLDLAESCFHIIVVLALHTRRVTAIAEISGLRRKIATYYIFDQQIITFQLNMYLLKSNIKNYLVGGGGKLCMVELQPGELPWLGGR